MNVDLVIALMPAEHVVYIDCTQLDCVTQMAGWMGKRAIMLFRPRFSENEHDAINMLFAPLGLLTTR